MKKFKKGLTLIEVIISIAILAIIITPILSLTLGTFKNTITAGNKLKAMNIAQKCLEEIKSKDYMTGIGDSDTTLNETVDGFEVVKTLSPVKDYQFPQKDTDSTNNNSINYNFQINVDEDDNVSWSSIFSGISMDYDMNKNLITLESSTDSDINIKVLLRGTKTIDFNLKSPPNKGWLNLYFIRSSEDDSQYNIIKTQGRVRIYSNIFDDSQGNNSKYRLYKITIQVKKDNNILQTLEGYKTFLR